MESMVSTQQHPRLAPALRLAGTYNTRDLGGHATADHMQVRWRRLIRSDALTDVTNDDIALLSRIGVATVVDLRSPSEVAQHGVAPVARFGARYAHVPVLAETWDPAAFGTVEVSDAHFLAERYCEMTDEGFDAIVNVLEIAAAATGPVIFHCAVGKDRTGVVAAILLGLLGVDDDAIAVDYARSEGPVARLIEQRWGGVPTNSDAPPVPPAFFAAPANAIRLWLHVFRGRAPRSKTRWSHAVSAGI